MATHPDHPYPSGALPPGPELSPEEQTFQWFARPLAFLDDCHTRYGDVFTLNFKGLGLHVVLTEPEAIRRVFTGSDEVLLAGSGNAILRPFLGARSLLLLDGDDYRAHRRHLMPPFHPKRIERHAAAMKRCAREAIARWPTDRPFPAMDAMLEVSIATIAVCLFGRGVEGRLEAALGRLLSAVAFSPVASGEGEAGVHEARAWQRYRTEVAELDRLLELEVERARRGEAADGLLAELLAPATDELVPLAGRDLRDELVTLLIAGHETTATALAWCFHELLRAPRALERVEAELSRGGDTPPVDGSSYIDAVIRESLRLHPPIPVVARRLAADFDVAGYALRPGIHVMPCIYLAHRRPETFDSPHEFRPERFLDAGFTPYQYFPFGGGVRRCLGMAFAQLEMRIVLAEALRQWRLVVSGPMPPPVRRSVVITPGSGERLEARAR